MKKTFTLCALFGALCLPLSGYADECNNAATTALASARRSKHVRT